MVMYSDLANTDLAELTYAWNRCWEGYYYQNYFSETQMSAWIEKNHVDLTNSVSIKHHEKIVGFSLLGVDKEMGWIAGTCIAPDFRGRDLFTPLLLNQLERAKKLTIQRLWLEVLSQNFAYKVYKKVGFKKTRELYVYRYSQNLTELKDLRNQGVYLREMQLEDYFQARKEAGFNPAWQRREAYLRHYSSVSAWLSFDEKSGMLLTKDTHLLLDAWTVAWDQADKLLSSVLTLTQGEFILTNQPKDWLTAYLTRIGINPSDIQYEMCYSINHSS